MNNTQPITGAETMTTRAKVSQPKTIDIPTDGRDNANDWGTEVEVNVGSVIELDSGRVEQLLDGDDYVDSGFAGCDFRYPNVVEQWRTKHAIAINVEITGRVTRYRKDARWVRVKIEWVGDCEASNFSGGWLLI